MSARARHDPVDFVIETLGERVSHCFIGGRTDCGLARHNRRSDRYYFSNWKSWRRGPALHWADPAAYHVRGEAAENRSAAAFLHLHINRLSVFAPRDPARREEEFRSIEHPLADPDLAFERSKRRAMDRGRDVFRLDQVIFPDLPLNRGLAGRERPVDRRSQRPRHAVL